MRYALVCVACLIVVAGCGGGGGSPAVDGSIRLKGVVSGGGQPAAIVGVAVYRQGACGLHDALVSNTTGPNVLQQATPFDLWIPKPGVYDLTVLYTDKTIGPDHCVTRDILNVEVKAPQTDLGTIDLGLPAP